jgi:hypothetical protein
MELTKEWNDFLVSFSECPQLASVWIKGAQDLSSLDAAEHVQFSSHAGRVFRVT